MIRRLLLLLLITSFLGACVKPHYKTTKGKKKNRYYNSIQYQEP